MDTKQVIIIRKDLNMRKGKMIAQGAHASLKVILDKMHVEKRSVTTHGVLEPRFREYSMIIPKRCALHEWLSGSFKKIVVGIDSEKELMDLYVEAQLLGLPHALIQDSGLTEFHGKPTYTCLAIGPEESEKIDRITGHLALL